MTSIEPAPTTDTLLHIIEVFVKACALRSAAATVAASRVLHARGLPLPLLLWHFAIGPSISASNWTIMVSMRERAGNLALIRSLRLESCSKPACVCLFWK